MFTKNIRAQWPDGKREITKRAKSFYRNTIAAAWSVAALSFTPLVVPLCSHFTTNRLEPFYVASGALFTAATIAVVTGARALYNYEQLQAMRTRSGASLHNG
jgi:hypothetical protein